jgi:hypothetical protein
MHHQTQYLCIHGLALFLTSSFAYGMEPASHKMSLSFMSNPRNQSITHVEPGEASLFAHAHQTVKDEIVARKERRIARVRAFEEQLLETNYACYVHIGVPSLYEIADDPTLHRSDETDQIETNLDTSEAEIDQLTRQSIVKINRAKREEDILQQSVHDALMNQFTAIEIMDNGIHLLRQQQSLNELSPEDEIILHRHQSQMNFIAQQYLPLVSSAATFHDLKANAKHVASLGIQKSKPHNNRVRTIRARRSIPVKKQ